jgi:creatinine amidohydrolase/Fe(II)-dependent formamide hydrolase-like protein
MVDTKDPLIREVWNYQELTGEGATGDGRAATAEKGRRMKAAIVDYVVAFLERKEREGWVIPRREV